MSINKNEVFNYAADYTYDQLKQPTHLEMFNSTVRSESIRKNDQGVWQKAYFFKTLGLRNYIEWLIQTKWSCRIGKKLPLSVHEILPHYKPAKLFVDIDCKIDNTADAYRCVVQPFISKMNEILRRELSFRTNDEQLICDCCMYDMFTSHGNGKASWLIIYNVVCDTPKTMRTLVEEASHAVHPRIRDCIDLAPYACGKSIRMPFSYKIEGTTPVRQRRYHNMKEWLSQQDPMVMMTRCTINAYHTLHTVDGVIKPRYGLHSTTVLSSHLQFGVQLPEHQDDSEVCEDDGYLEKLCDLYPDLRGCFTPCHDHDKIILRKNCCWHCPICNRQHENDNAFIGLRGRPAFFCYRNCQSSEQTRSIKLGQAKNSTAATVNRLSREMQPSMKDYNVYHLNMQYLPNNYVDFIDRNTYRIQPTIMVYSPCNTGKTSSTIEFIKSQSAIGRRTLYITDRVALINDFADSLDKAGVHYNHYKSGFEQANVHLYCVNSIHKLEFDQQWHNVIIDEVASVVHHLVSSVSSLNAAHTYNSIISKAERFIGLDGTMTELSIKHIDDLRRNNHGSVILLNNQYKPFKDRLTESDKQLQAQGQTIKSGCKVHITRGILNKNNVEESQHRHFLLNLFQNGLFEHKVMIPCDEAGIAVDCHRYLRELMPNKDIRLFTAIQGTATLNKQEVLNNADVIIFSPTFQYGVDFNDERWRYTIAILTHKSIDVLGQIQLIMRNRQAVMIHIFSRVNKDLLERDSVPVPTLNQCINSVMKDCHTIFKRSPNDVFHSNNDLQVADLTRIDAQRINITAFDMWLKKASNFAREELLVKQLQRYGCVYLGIRSIDMSVDTGNLAAPKAIITQYKQDAVRKVIRGDDIRLRESLQNTCNAHNSTLDDVTEDSFEFLNLMADQRRVKSITKMKYSIMNSSMLRDIYKEKAITADTASANRYAKPREHPSSMAFALRMMVSILNSDEVPFGLIEPDAEQFKLQWGNTNSWFESVLSDDKLNKFKLILQVALGRTKARIKIQSKISNDQPVTNLDVYREYLSIAKELFCFESMKQSCRISDKAMVMRYTIDHEKLAQNVEVALRSYIDDSRMQRIDLDLLQRELPDEVKTSILSFADQCRKDNSVKLSGTINDMIETARRRRNQLVANDATVSSEFEIPAIN